VVFINPSISKGLTVLIHIPQNAVLCHYAETTPGKWAVVTPWHKVLGASFFELRHRFVFHSAINGAGAWIVLIPRPSSSSQELASQPSLF